ncbi:MAG TPA: oligosaccharide flippase family protein, partial [Candidatus Saccharimonadales bacterium]|nr:oligosaccharide flippase family protein [Candidatus Saccharimonadales bacterium]
MFKKVIFNTGAQIIGKGITASITLLVTLIIGKTLGASGYGDYVKITVFVGYFYTLADFGLNAIYVKLTGENDTKNLKTLIGLRAIIGITLALLAILVGNLLPYNSALSTGFSPLVKTGILIAVLTIVTQALFTTTNAFYQKNLRYDLSTISAATSYIFVLATAIFVALTTKSLLGYIAAYTVGGIVLVITSLGIIAKRTKTIPTPSFKLEEFKKFLKPAWPVGVALIFNLIYF